jgi:hypothetical protein
MIYIELQPQKPKNKNNISFYVLDVYDPGISQSEFCFKWIQMQFIIFLLSARYKEGFEEETRDKDSTRSDFIL